ncbi:MAG: GDSL-type esterase/lipase family protein [Oscillospiraceae bacterium]|jgi:lysophospholipase L1-like esterase|nr:GDSL-type esterase/lipase family protein [Oscillospiraceae bacterium]
MKAGIKGLSILLCVMLLSFSVPLAAFSQDSSDYTWVGSWSTSPVKAGVKVGGIRLMDFLSNRTVRSVVQLTLGGNALRVRVSNLYGESPLKIEAASIARTNPKNEEQILAGSSKNLTFNGQASVTVPVGQYLYSDPVKMNVVALETLSISYYINSFTNISTAGFYGATSYVAAGNQIGAESLSRATPLLFSSGSITYHTIPFLTNVDVNAPGAYSVVIFGDSTVTNQSPYYLAEKFAENGVNNIGVLQQGIVANRLLYDSENVSTVGMIYGEAGIDRFAHDVVSQAGVKKVFIKIGINDVLHPMTKSMEGKAPYSSVQDIIAGYQKLITMAHAAKIEVYFFFRTPWKGYTRDFALSPSNNLTWNVNAEGMLRSLNEWIKNTNTINGYIDTDSLRDSADRNKLRADYTTDGVHFSDLGARALVDCIPMQFFGLKTQNIKSISSIYADGEGGKVHSAYVPPDPSAPAQTTTAPDSSNPTEPPEGAETTTNTIVEDTSPTEYTTRVISVILDGEDNPSGEERETQSPTKRIVGAVLLLFVGFVAIAGAYIYFMKYKKDETKAQI